MCIEGPPQRQCYTAPEDFGRDAEATVVQLEKGAPAVFLSAASGGVSGFQFQLALLRPGQGTILEDLFMSGTSVSNYARGPVWLVRCVASKLLASHTESASPAIVKTKSMKFTTGPGGVPVRTIGTKWRISSLAR